MSLEKFLNQAVSSWMSSEGPDADIILSSRIRLARNLRYYKFPTLFSNEEAREVIQKVSEALHSKAFESTGALEFLEIDQLKSLEKRVLVEKHLISPHFAEQATQGACTFI